MDDLYGDVLVKGDVLMALRAKMAWLIIVFGLGVYILGYGTPAALYYSFVDHSYSIAYDGRSKSYLKDGGHHLRVCDNSIANGFNATARAHVPGGRNHKVTDTNGRRPGCGDTRFRGDASWHETYEGLTPGGRSEHPGPG